MFSSNKTCGLPTSASEDCLTPICGLQSSLSLEYPGDMESVQEASGSDDEARATHPEPDSDAERLSPLLTHPIANGVSDDFINRVLVFYCVAGQRPPKTLEVLRHELPRTRERKWLTKIKRTGNYEYKPGYVD